MMVITMTIVGGEVATLQLLLFLLSLSLMVSIPVVECLQQYCDV